MIDIKLEYERIETVAPGTTDESSAARDSGRCRESRIQDTGPGMS